MDQKQQQLEQPIVQEDAKTTVVGDSTRSGFFQPNFMRSFADEVAKLVIAKLPKRSDPPKKKNKPKPKKDAVNGYFLDTSAIIDGRILDLIKTGLLQGGIIILDNALLELKHIADAKDPVRKERGKRGLAGLNAIKKTRGIKVIALASDKEIVEKHKEVDEQLIFTTKLYKGKLVTCDYNLEKKASIHGVSAINVHTLSHILKVAAVPGETLQLKIAHVGKDATQGVGYLPDGTMIVVEKGSLDIDKEISVTVSRVIQTANGKILFAKK